MYNIKTLFVSDVQGVNMEPNPQVTSDGDDLIPKCRGLIDKARAAGVPVVYLQHLSDDQPDDPALVAVHPDIAPALEEPVIPKWFGSAFFKTDLDQWLREKGVTLCAVGGIATNFCVLTTVMDATCHDFKTVLLEDCSAAVSEEIHTQTLETYRRNPLYPLLRVMRSSEFIDSLFAKTSTS